MTASKAIAPSHDASSMRKQVVALDRKLRELRRALLVHPGERNEPGFPLRAVVLRVGSHWIAIPVTQVIAVEPMVFVSPLPGAPSAVRGSVNYRGRLAAVLDLHDAVSGTPVTLAPEMFLTFVDAEPRLFALAVDAVDDVLTFDAADLIPPTDVTQLPSFALALLTSDERAVTLLDPPGLLAAGELDLLDLLIREGSTPTEDSA